MAAEHTAPSWRQTSKRRIAVAAVACVAWSVAIEARLVYLQVVQRDFLINEAKKQQLETEDLEPKRGDIFDRNGQLLASDVPADSVYAVPPDVVDPAATIAALCKALEDCKPGDAEVYVGRIKRRDDNGRLKPYAPLRRKISDKQSERVRALALKGIGMETETRRFYPKRELAAHVLGFVGDKNKGLVGLEQRYDDLVGGQPGRRLMQVDIKRRAFSRTEQPPTPGQSLKLTIDSTIQYFAERELAAGVEWSGADGGSVIVMDPITGQVLAMANYPTFNPNAFKQFPEEVWTNRATQYVYEPGSTFKIVTAGASLQERLARPSELIHTSPGTIRFGARVIGEAKGHNYGTITFEEVIVKSSNVGAIQIGLEVGAERLSHYVARFGFGSRTAQVNPQNPKAPRGDFSGESAGKVWPVSKLDRSAVASVSMGYQVSVTPLQMAAAFSAVANGGELIEPRVVQAVIRDGVEMPIPRKVVRRVLDADVAAQLTTIMEGVVERGTAEAAQVEGFTVAGKTGTAAKALPEGGYSKRDFNVSFVGFVPSRKPVFTILVVIDSPHKVSPYGGTVAAPIFQKIAAAALRHRGVPPTLNPPARVLIARKDAVRQQPVSGPADAVVALAADTPPGVLPSLVGMNARDATLALVRLGVRPHLNGDGFVVSQRPAAGSALEDIDQATLWLDRRARPEPPVADAPSPSPAREGHVAPRGRP
jgi:cell division protein FtsI/penicillin-binding protein 2